MAAVKRDRILPGQLPDQLPKTLLTLYLCILNEYDEYPLPTFVYLSYFIRDIHLTICFHSHTSSNFYLIIGAF